MSPNAIFEQPSNKSALLDIAAISDLGPQDTMPKLPFLDIDVFSIHYESSISAFDTNFNSTPSIKYFDNSTPEEFEMLAQLRQQNREIDIEIQIHEYVHYQMSRAKGCAKALTLTQQTNSTSVQLVPRKSIVDNDCCGICLEEFTDKELRDATWCSRQCGSNFHAKCIAHWISQNTKAVLKDSQYVDSSKYLSCPQCRAHWLPGTTQNQQYIGTITTNKWQRIDAIASSAIAKTEIGIPTYLSAPQTPPWNEDCDGCYDCYRQATVNWVASIRNFRAVMKLQKPLEHSDYEKYENDEASDDDSDLDEDLQDFDEDSNSDSDSDSDSDEDSASDWDDDWEDTDEEIEISVIVSPVLPAHLAIIQHFSAMFQGLT